MFPEICMVGAKVIQFSAKYFGACFVLFCGRPIKVFSEAMPICLCDFFLSSTRTQENITTSKPRNSRCFTFLRDSLGFVQHLTSVDNVVF